MKKILLGLCLIAASIFYSGCGGGGSGGDSDSSSIVEKVEINSAEIAKNLVGENSIQNIEVYLPPDYDESEKNYPVLYFLGGYGDTTDVWFNNSYGLSIQDSMDSMIEDGSSKSMIIAVISGKNVFDGSFYTNSPITGNWEDYVVKEVVAKVDSRYRTIKTKEGRGIAGHSMGGHGALEIGMKYPEIFSAVYALSPGLFDENGLEDFLFSSESAKSSFVAFGNNMEAMSDADAQTSRNSRMASIKQDSWTYIRDVYGFAYAGNSSKKSYMDIPYYLENSSVKENSDIAKWRGGYGNVKEKIASYKLKTEKLNAIGLEVGDSDEYPWLIRGCDYFKTQMDSAGITVSYTKFAGKHQDKLKERVENYLIPFFNSKLSFE